MEPITRRSLLGAAVAGVALSACSGGPENRSKASAAGLPGVRSATPPPIPAYTPHAAFPEGIISGSPLPEAIVFWTRVAPAALPAESNAAAADTGGVEVLLQLSSDPGFSNVLTTRTAPATPDHDHCVHFDVDGLTPSSWYYYRFVVGDPAAPSPVTSPVGRTRTAPAHDEKVAASEIAFFSCQRYTHGWFTSHRHLAGQRNVDLVISLGDYVYQDSKADGITVAGRLDPTEPAHDLATFRKKYEFYRSDPDLQAMHAAAPFVCVPDNHDGRDGPWEDPEFVAGSIGAFFERMPVRRDPQNPQRIHGEFQWGDLFHLWLLDVRQYRTRSPEDTFDSSTDTAPLDAARTMLGMAQKDWLKQGLATSKARWKLIGSQQMFSPTRISDLDDVATRAANPDRPLNAGVYINGSQWDGYQAERREILTHLRDHKVTGTIVLSGDMHWFAAGDGQLDVDDPASPYLYSEFVGGSITSAAGEKFASNGGLVTPGILPVVRAANEQLIRFFDVDRHGYGAVRMSPKAAEIDFVSPTTITKPNAPVEVLASFRIPHGGSGMKVTKGAQW